MIMKLFISSWLIAVDNIIFQTDFKERKRDWVTNVIIYKDLKYLGPSPDSLQKTV